MNLDQGGGPTVDAALRRRPGLGRIAICGGLAGALALGVGLGVWSRPDLGHRETPAPMQPVDPAQVKIEIARMAPPPAIRSTGKLEVLPADMVQAAPRPSAPAPRPDEAPMPEPAAVSHDCRWAGSLADQRVCESPELAAADRHMRQSYRRALAADVSTRQMRQDQQDFLDIREDAARASPGALASVYRQRIAELDAIAETDGRDY